MSKFVVIFSLMLMCFGGAANSEPQDVQDEVQVLIDVSGSMKQNDPDNLRIEAAKLLVSLLPENCRATVWLFAENTTQLTHSDAVDAAWKNQALKVMTQIHSQGLYTHIEDAIQTALNNGFKSGGNKHLILLTDGVVDISKDIMVSADSRERVLSEWIPKLQQENILVETIALSDQADKELLDKLAFDTGGWTETAESAEQLQRAFLKMVQKAAPKDTLPLVGNQFAVDGNVKEFSVLAFKKPKSAPSQLLTPDQKKINKQMASPDVAWLENPAYDLITVKQPGVGDWRLDAETDPDNQVMIVTDLKLRVGDLPNFVAEKEAVTLKAHLTEQGKPIVRPDFLNMVSLAVSLDQAAPMAMEPVIAEPGVFARSFDALGAGKHVFTITADGKTFKREISREIEVIATPLAVEKEIDPVKREVTLHLIPDAKWIDAKTLAVEATIHRADTPQETRRLEGGDGGWSLKLTDFPPGSETTVNFSAKANTLDGKVISPAIKPVSIDDAVFHEAAGEIAGKQQVASNPRPAESSGSSEQKNEAAQVVATDWLMLGGMILAVNILVLPGGVLIYRAIKKANAKKQQALLERLS